MPEQQQEYWGTQFLENEYALEALYEPELRGYLDMLARQRSPGTLLDVGCSFGAFVKVARQSGWDAEGIDTSAAAIAFGTERLGVPLRAGDALCSDLRPGYYDVVTILDVIEHQLDPGPLLSHIGSLLGPGGFLLVETPDHDSFYNVLYGWYNSANNMLASLTRGRWDRPLPMYYAYEHENLYQSGHVLHFTAHSLEKLLARHGFRLVEMHKQFSNIDYLVARNRSAAVRLAIRVAHAASRLLRRPNKLVALFEVSAESAIPSAPVRQTRNLA